MFVGGVSLVVNLLALTAPIYMMQIFDRVLTSRSEDTLTFLFLIGIGAVLALAVLELSRSRILVRVSVWLDDVLSPKALERSIAYQLQGRSYATQSLQDIGVLKNLLGGPTIFSLFDTPWVPIYLLVVFLLHPLLGVVATCGALVLFVFAWLNEWSTSQPLNWANNLATRVHADADMMSRNAGAVDAMGMSEGIIARWMTSRRRMLALQRHASDTSGLFVSMTKFLRLAVQIGLLTIGAALVLQQEITAGAMIGASIIMSRALQPVEQAIGTWKQVVAARAAYDRLKHYFGEASPREESMSLPEPEGHLSVEEVSYIPPGTLKPVLKSVSFEESPGRALAIIGPSASGKSTLARLIVGNWRPNDGTVRLDGADVFAWNRLEFGRHAGYLPQDVELFAGSVSDNIARMKDAAPDEIVEAARRAGAHDMILRLPKGYETEVGDNGLYLSSGQRQRIALARALFGNPKLIVLDEPNSNLDMEGEEALLGAIRTMKAEGATIVLIAHRQSVLADVDDVLLLRAGRVEAVGPKDDILAGVTQPRIAQPQAGKSQAGQPRVEEQEAKTLLEQQESLREAAETFPPEVTPEGSPEEGGKPDLHREPQLGPLSG